jgi:hypothetical protein
MDGRYIIGHHVMPPDVEGRSDRGLAPPLSSQEGDSTASYGNCAGVQDKTPPLMQDQG